MSTDEHCCSSFLCLSTDVAAMQVERIHIYQVTKCVILIFNWSVAKRLQVILKSFICLNIFYYYGIIINYAIFFLHYNIFITTVRFLSAIQNKNTNNITYGKRHEWKWIYYDIFGYNNNKIIKNITIDFKQWCSRTVNALRRMIILLNSISYKNINVREVYLSLQDQYLLKNTVNL